MPLLAPLHLTDCENIERRRYPAIYREAPSSAQLGPDRLDVRFFNELRTVAINSRYTELEQAFSQLRDQITFLRSLSADWDSYGAPAPDMQSIDAADRALRTFREQNEKPTAVLPTTDGGVGICFVRGQFYSHIEFTNEGEVWAVMYGPTGQPESWQLPSSNPDSLIEGWTRISAHLQS
jgi:hypothetical protein